MSDTGKQSPLGANLLNSLLLNTGLQVNRQFREFVGTSTELEDPEYIFGTIVKNTVLKNLTYAINKAYYGNTSGKPSAEVYNNLINIGGQIGSIPIISITSLPEEFTVTYNADVEFSPGSYILINGASPIGYNGAWKITEVVGKSLIIKNTNNYGTATTPGTFIYSRRIPALGNAKPFPYTWEQLIGPYGVRANWDSQGWGGSLYKAWNPSTSWGFIRLLALQTEAEWNYNNTQPEYRDFLGTFVDSFAFITYSNSPIFAMSNALNYLDGTFSQMSDLMTADVTSVSKATTVWGQDLVKLGKAIDLSTIDTFGLPSNLLKILANNNALTTNVNLALLSSGLQSREITDIINGNSNFNFEKKLYGSFSIIVGESLYEVLRILKCNTQGISSLADLLDPKKLFPNSYKSLTVPIYNDVPITNTAEPSTPNFPNSRRPVLIYSDGGVNSELSLSENINKVGYLIPQGIPSATDRAINNIAEINLPSNGNLGFASITGNILPNDIAIAAGAFSVAMSQIRNIKNTPIDKFAQIVYNLEVINNTVTPNIDGTNVPIDKQLREVALPKIALGSGPQGSYTMSDFFGCTSGLPYNGPLSTALTTIKQLQTKYLDKNYKNIYLAVTWEKPSIVCDTALIYENVFPYDPGNPTGTPPVPESAAVWNIKYQITGVRLINAGGGYRRENAPNPVTYMNDGSSATIAIVANNDPDTIPYAYGKITDVVLLNTGVPVLIEQIMINGYNAPSGYTPPVITVDVESPPVSPASGPDGGPNGFNSPPSTVGWPLMNAVVQKYIDYANEEIDRIVSNPLNTVPVRRLNASWNAIGAQLSIEQRAREQGLKPKLELPRDANLYNYPQIQYVFVDTMPGFALNTAPHMYSQTVQAISNLSTAGGQSAVALLSESRNKYRLELAGIYQDNNIPDSLTAEEIKTLIGDGSLALGSNDYKPTTFADLTQYLNDSTVKPLPYGYYDAEKDLYIIDNPILSQGYDEPYLDVGASSGLDQSPYVNFIPTNLNTFYFSKNLLPSTYTVNEAIDNINLCKHGPLDYVPYTYYEKDIITKTQSGYITTAIYPPIIEGVTEGETTLPPIYGEEFIVVATPTVWNIGILQTGSIATNTITVYGITGAGGVTILSGPTPPNWTVTLNGDPDPNASVTFSLSKNETFSVPVTISTTSNLGESVAGYWIVKNNVTNVTQVINWTASAISLPEYWFAAYRSSNSTLLDWNNTPKSISVLDGVGNLYNVAVIGWNDSGQYKDFITITKHNKFGIIQYSKVYSYIGSYYPELYGADISYDDTKIFVQYYQSYSTASDIIAFSTTDGTILWHKGNNLNSDSAPFRVAVGPSLLYTISYDQATDTRRIIALSQTDGTVVWAKIVQPVTGTYWGMDELKYAGGDIYILGYQGGGFARSGYFVMSINGTTGQFNWAKVFYSSNGDIYYNFSSTEQVARDFDAVANQSNQAGIYISYYSRDYGDVNPYWDDYRNGIVKLNSQGNFVYKRQFMRTGREFLNDIDMYPISADSNDDVYVMPGYSYNVPDSYPVWQSLGKISSTSQSVFQWENQFIYSFYNDYSNYTQNYIYAQKTGNSLAIAGEFILEPDIDYITYYSTFSTYKLPKDGSGTGYYGFDGITTNLFDYAELPPQTTINAAFLETDNVAYTTSNVIVSLNTYSYLTLSPATLTAELNYLGYTFIPNNDNLANSTPVTFNTPLTANSVYTLLSTTQGATIQTGETSNIWPGYNSVWYNFTSTASSGMVTAGVYYFNDGYYSWNGQFDLNISVQTGNTFSSNTITVSNYQNAIPQIKFVASQNTPYYIRVSTQGEDITGLFNFIVSKTPDNDNIANSISTLTFSPLVNDNRFGNVSSNTSVFTTGNISLTNTGATLESNENGEYYPGFYSVWYKVLANLSQNYFYRVTTSGESWGMTQYSNSIDTSTKYIGVMGEQDIIYRNTPVDFNYGVMDYIQSILSFEPTGDFQIRMYGGTPYDYGQTKLVVDYAPYMQIYDTFDGSSGTLIINRAMNTGQWWTTPYYYDIPFSLNGSGGFNITSTGYSTCAGQQLLSPFYFAELEINTTWTGSGTNNSFYAIFIKCPPTVPNNYNDVVRARFYPRGFVEVVYTSYTPVTFISVNTSSFYGNATIKISYDDGVIRAYVNNSLVGSYTVSASLKKLFYWGRSNFAGLGGDNPTPSTSTMIVNSFKAQNIPTTYTYQNVNPNFVKTFDAGSLQKTFGLINAVFDGGFYSIGYVDKNLGYGYLTSYDIYGNINYTKYYGITGQYLQFNVGVYINGGSSSSNNPGGIYILGQGGNNSSLPVFILTRIDNNPSNVSVMWAREFAASQFSFVAQLGDNYIDKYKQPYPYSYYLSVISGNNRYITIDFEGNIFNAIQIDSNVLGEAIRIFCATGGNYEGTEMTVSGYLSNGTNTKGIFILIGADVATILYQVAFNSTMTNSSSVQVLQDSRIYRYVYLYMFGSTATSDTISIIKYDFLHNQIAWQKGLTSPKVGGLSLFKDGVGQLKPKLISGVLNPYASTSSYILMSTVINDGTKSKILIVCYTIEGTLMWQNVLYHQTLDVVGYAVSTQAFTIYITGYIKTTSTNETAFNVSVPLNGTIASGYIPSPWIYEASNLESVYTDYTPTAISCYTSPYSTVVSPTTVVQYNSLP